VITEDSSGTRTTTRTSRQVHINTGGVKSELTAKDGTDSPDALEIGATWLASAQRTRYNTEAKYLMLTHAFDVWRVHRVALNRRA